MNPITYVCAHCGSKNIFIQAKAVWNVEKQSWTLAEEEKLQDVYCTECRPGNTFPTNKKEVELKTEIVQFEMEEKVSCLGQIKVAPSQVLGLKQMRREEQLEAIERLITVPDCEFSVVMSNVTDREILDKPVHFLFGEGNKKE